MNKRKAAGSASKKMPPKKKIHHLPLARQPDGTVKGGPEKKNQDNNQTLTIALNGTGVVSSLLTQLAQAAGSTNRIGRKTKLVSLDLRFFVFQAAAATGGASYRVKVVYDKQANGAVMAATDILAIDALVSPNNLDNSDRFVTVLDVLVDATSTQNNFTVAGHEYRKLDLEQIWLGNTASGAITSLLTGSLYLWVWGTASTLLTSASTLTYYTRTRFVDN